MKIIRYCDILVIKKYIIGPVAHERHRVGTFPFFKEQSTEVVGNRIALMFFQFSTRE